MSSIFRRNEMKIRFTRTEEIRVLSISNSEKERTAARFQIWKNDTSTSSSHFFRLVRRSFFIYRCLSPKTHASHHYKIADYSGIGAAGPFYPFRLDRPERGIEDGSERSRQSFETEERGRRRRRGKKKRKKEKRGPLIGGIRRPLRSRRGKNAAEGAARKNKAIPSGTRVTWCIYHMHKRNRSGGTKVAARLMAI